MFISNHKFKSLLFSIHQNPLNYPIKTKNKFSIVTMACLDIMLGELVDTVKGDIKHGTYELTKKIAYKLKETPEVGSDEEINAAWIIVEAYLQGNNKTPPPTFQHPLFPYLLPKIKMSKYSEGQKGCNVCKSCKDTVIALELLNA
jgi:hypothetical protein